MNRGIFQFIQFSSSQRSFGLIHIHSMQVHYHASSFTDFCWAGWFSDISLNLCLDIPHSYHSHAVNYFDWGFQCISSFCPGEYQDITLKEVSVISLQILYSPVFMIIQSDLTVFKSCRWTLSNSMSRVLEKLIDVQQMKKFPAFCGTWRFLPGPQECTTESYHETDESSPHLTPLRSILIFSQLCGGIPSALLLSGFVTKMLYLSSPKFVNPAQLILSWFYHDNNNNNR